jgi:hypothetical protein
MDVIERSPRMNARDTALRPVLITDGSRYGQGCVLANIANRDTKAKKHKHYVLYLKGKSRF